MSLQRSRIETESVSKRSRCNFIPHPTRCLEYAFAGTNRQRLLFAEPPAETKQLSISRDSDSRRVPEIGFSALRTRSFNLYHPGNKDSGRVRGKSKALQPRFRKRIVESTLVLRFSLFVFAHSREEHC